ncbi:MAG TPA: uroporphyrinogen decarboxylase family protein [Armatimonadota bacterium]|jgi:uroporphyrinogen decarboxylase
MTHHERIARIYAGQPADRPGFWLGHPHPETLAKLLERFGVADEETLRRTIDDDCRTNSAEGAYCHPEGRPIFDVRYGNTRKVSHGDPGCFAECEDVAMVEDYPWPDAKYLDFSSLRARVEAGGDCWRLGGTWGCFFHNVADFFGMENYFMKMYTDPEVVHAVTRRVVDFYLATNRRLFSEESDLVDAFFFGNDFGTQEDLLISPELFKEFVLPYFKELIALAKSFGKPTQLHSCGAIAKVIPWLIDAGMDALHPLQAKAKGMDAVSLARDFKGKIVFVGGVDTQELLWRGTPQQVKDEVARLRDIFGERWIISPSHEVLMPEVPVENIVALCEAATGKDFS